MEFVAALLLGGDSSRMGSDKALLEDGGVPLWEIQADKLEALAPSERLLLVRADQSMEREDWTRLVDPPDRAGPLRVLISALESADGCPVLFLAVDLPRLSVASLRDLIETAPSSQVGVIGNDGDHLQTVAALWPAAALGPAREALETKVLSLQRLARRGLADGWMKEIEWSKADCANVNTPEEASALLSPRSTPVVVTRHYGNQAARQSDAVAREEPLQIRVEGNDIAVLMRTPGDDRELVAGFLLTEGVVSEPGHLFEISECPSAQRESGVTYDVLLGPGAKLDLEKLSRHVFAASSCGVCGKATIDAVLQRVDPLTEPLPVASSILAKLPDELARTQRVFRRTGGLHACALFDPKGNLIEVREDVGRHNALDKLLGHALLEDRLPLQETILLLSGRVSLEMMQKALAGGIPVVVAISAPTSLAVEFARESGQTLVGFLRGDRMNVYTGEVQSD